MKKNVLTETHKKNWAAQHSELFYWASYEQFKSKMNLPLEKVSKIPRGALTINIYIKETNKQPLNDKLELEMRLRVSVSHPRPAFFLNYDLSRFCFLFLSLFSVVRFSPHSPLSTPSYKLLRRSINLLSMSIFGFFFVPQIYKYLQSPFRDHL